VVYHNPYIELGSIITLFTVKNHGDFFRFAPWKSESVSPVVAESPAVSHDVRPVHLAVVEGPWRQDPVERIGGKTATEFCYVISYIFNKGDKESKESKARNAKKKTPLQSIFKNLAWKYANHKKNPHCLAVRKRAS